MKIPLTKNRFAFIDRQDYDKIKQWKWTCGGSITKKFYARRYSKGKTIYMHRQIMDFPDLEVDHVNGNTLDNRRKNLRIATHTENSKNRMVNKNSSSQLKGIWWYEKLKRWQVYIKTDRKRKYLGVFKDKILASKAYNDAALKYHGKYAKFNKV